MESSTVTTSLDARRDAYDDANDWLNVLVRKRIARERESPEAEMSPEIAWVAQRGHAVYQKRWKPLVALFLVAIYSVPALEVDTSDLVKSPWEAGRNANG